MLGRFVWSLGGRCLRLLCMMSIGGLVECMWMIVSL